jgi:hypothetical protein
VWVSSDPATSWFSGNTGNWLQEPTTVTFPVTVPAFSLLSFFYPTRSAAFIGIIPSGSIVAAGTDTADLIIVQSSNSTTCSNIAASNAIQGVVAQGVSSASVNPVLISGWEFIAGGGLAKNNEVPVFDSTTFGLLIGNSTGAWADSIGNVQSVGMNYGNGVATPTSVSVEPMGSADDTASPGTVARLKNHHKTGLMVSNQFAWASSELKGYFAQADLVNPTAGLLLLGIMQSGTSDLGIVLDKVTVGCSVACDLLLNRTSDSGIGCTAATNGKGFDEGVGVAANAIAIKGTCGTSQPTVTNTVAHWWLPANTTQIFDLTGFWMFNVSTDKRGFEVLVNTAFTGTASATMLWGDRN